MITASMLNETVDEVLREIFLDERTVREQERQETLPMPLWFALADVCAFVATCLIGFAVIYPTL